PNGTWSLYIQDNIGGDFGAVNGGWTLTITPGFAFSNTNAISFSTTGNTGGTATAAPYPSTLSVAGLTGNVSKVSLLLNGLTINQCPADVSFLLQGPQGQFIIPYSLVGPCFSPVNGLNLVLNDD